MKIKRRLRLSPEALQAIRDGLGHEDPSDNIRVLLMHIDALEWEQRVREIEAETDLKRRGAW